MSCLALGAMRGLIVVLALGASAGWTSTDLGTPPGQPDGFVHAVGVNARGSVIAESMTGGGSAATLRERAFVWRNGKLTVLKYGRSRYVEVWAINERGDIIGDATLSEKHDVGILWRNG